MVPLILRIFNRLSKILRVSIAFCLAFNIISGTAMSGSPFKTDDPEPVEYKHYEISLASQYSNDKDQGSATLPHVEFNYGLAPNLEFHLLAPFYYMKQEGQSSQYGYGDTEIGFKYRFIEETPSRPQVATAPLIEIPSGDSSKGLGNGKAQYYLPLWLQKSWGHWTTYGGGGYWINPGDGNRNWLYLGWQAQREITKNLTLGAEIYYNSASKESIDESKGFTIGAIINFTEHHHLLLSAGQDVWGPNYFNSYFAYQYTFGP